MKAPLCSLQALSQSETGARVQACLSDAPRYHSIVEARSKAVGGSDSSEPPSAHSGWQRLKRNANSGHKTLRPNRHFHAASNEMKSSSFFPSHHLCHITLPRSTPSSQRGFFLKYINLSSLSCHYSSWDLMYLPLLLSASLPLPVIGTMLDEHPQASALPRRCQVDRALSVRPPIYPAVFCILSTVSQFHPPSRGFPWSGFYCRSLV